jgi:predicted lipase
MYRYILSILLCYKILDDYNITTTFPGGGTVHKFYYNGLISMWNNGLRDAFFTAKNTYPTYELWVIGGSLGGALAAITSSYISQLGYMNPKDIKMFSFGEPRIGHMDFASRYASLVPWAYRVVHRNDEVPHAIPLTAGYRHHGNEV